MSWEYVFTLTAAEVSAIVQHLRNALPGAHFSHGALGFHIFGSCFGFDVRVEHNDKRVIVLLPKDHPSLDGNYLPLWRQDDIPVRDAARVVSRAFVADLDFVIRYLSSPPGHGSCFEIIPPGASTKPILGVGKEGRP